MAKPALSRFFAALISLSLVFATAPSFAAMGCCDPINMALHMADQPMGKMAQQNSPDQQQNMPCKMPAGSCASICAGMATIALIAPQVASPVPAFVSEQAWSVTSLSNGISRPPALPPPISIA